jgi:hypothetical protein
MFETVIAAMLKHKQIVFAAIAVAALSGMVIAPSTQVARAQLGEDIANSVLDSVFGDDDNGDEEAAATEDQSGDDNQDIDQTQDQENDQEADVDQEVTQSNSQDESNVQANELDTGDNTATVAQSNREDQDVSADADVKDSSANAASEADAEDDDHIKAKKSHVSESDTTSAESQADAIISATAEATGIQGDQSNTADVDQDSSIHDVDLSNNVAFGDDTNTQVAVPISDIDQRAANLAEQRAANLDVEENEVLPYGFTVSPGGEVVDCFPPSGATPPPFCD